MTMPVKLTDAAKKQDKNPVPQNFPESEIVATIRNLRKDGLFHNARSVLLEALQRTPSSVVLKKELILLDLDSDQLQEAEALLKKMLEDNPSDRWAHLTMGLTYARSRNRVREVAHLTLAVSLQYEDVLARRLFELQRELGMLDDALVTLDLIRSKKDDLTLQMARTQLLRNLKKFDEAIADAERIIKESTPAPILIVDLWASLMIQEKNAPDRVEQFIRPMIAAGRKEGAFYYAVSKAQHRYEKNKEASESLKQALALEPNVFHWRYDYAVACRQMGLLEESQRNLEAVLEKDPLNVTCMRVYGVEHAHTYGDPATKRINRALAHYDIYKAEKKVELHFAAAKALEDCGELAAAFDHYKEAGKLQAALTPYNHKTAESLMKLTRLNTSKELFAKQKKSGCDSEKPVFVLGMPRSGTTLMEQIIASHPEVYGAGELKVLYRVLDKVVVNKQPIYTQSEERSGLNISGVNLDCGNLSLKERGERYVQALEALAAQSGRADVTRVVDKMPGNYFWTGLIPVILPNAKIIHTRRHPVDTCVSIYRIFFPDGMPWSYDLTNLGKTYRAYHEHMAHWQKMLPSETLLSVQYERVVADMASQAKKVISHVGLKWNDQCLRFYETERLVKTASLNQVRKPIYTSSVGRWKKYKDFLGPLLKELGNLVADYEEEIRDLGATK